MALIEIDGLPIKNGGSFHGYVSHNQMVNRKIWGKIDKSCVIPKLVAAEDPCISFFHLPPGELPRLASAEYGLYMLISYLNHAKIPCDRKKKTPF